MTMIPENNDERPENPFIAKYQEHTFETTQLGLEFPLHLHWDRSAMQRVASTRIIREKIEDEAGKIKVYEETKAQFKEYEEWLRSQGVPEPGASSKPSSPESTPISQQDKDEAEFQRGYESRMQDEEKLHDGTYDTPFYQGFHAAGHELYLQKMRRIEEELKEKGGTEFQADTMENLVKTVKDIDNRLRKLERYTQE